MKTLSTSSLAFKNTVFYRSLRVHTKEFRMTSTANGCASIQSIGSATATATATGTAYAVE